MKGDVKERPVLFSGPMVRAILDGRKKMTRRVVRPQPDLSAMRWNGERWERCYGYPAGHDGMEHECPYQPGDRLWVRETFGYAHADGEGGNPVDWVIYKADGDCDERCGRWRPSIHMPRWASRITLEVVWVRVERVREITVEDARAEGVGDTARERAAQDRAGGKDTAFSYRAAFARLWDGIYAGRGFGWDADPWVWVIGFRVAEVRR